MLKKVLFITLGILLLVMPLLAGCSQAATSSATTSSAKTSTTSAAAQPTTSAVQPSTTSTAAQPATSSASPKPSTSTAQPSTTSTAAQPVASSASPKPSTSAGPAPLTPRAPPVSGGKDIAPPPPPPPPKANDGPQPPDPPGPPPPPPIADDLPISSGNMKVTSTAVKEGGELGDKYTCNLFLTESTDRPVSLPISWTGAPAKTKSFAVIIWHTRVAADEGIFFLVYNIPATATGLPEAIKADLSDPKIGTVGQNTKYSNEYYAPCGGSAGIYKYNILVYALSAEPQLPSDPTKVDANVLRTAIKDTILDTGSMTFNVNYKGQ